MDFFRTEESVQEANIALSTQRKMEIDAANAPKGDFLQWSNYEETPDRQK